MWKVTGDSLVFNKLNYLLNEWEKTIEEDGYFFYGDNPNALHYEFDKIACGLVDIYEYIGEGKALQYLRKMMIRNHQSETLETFKMRQSIDGTPGTSVYL